MDEKLLEKLEVLAGCVDADEGKPRLLIDGRVAKYDPVAVQNARAVQWRMAGVSEQNRRNEAE